MILSIVITSYCEDAKRYLDLCVESIFNSSFDVRKDAEIILVTKPGYHPIYDGVKTCSPDKKSFANPVGLNFGISQTNPKSKFILLCNDDVILSKDAIKNMIDSIGDGQCVVNPITQCDNGVCYHLHFPITTKLNGFDQTIDFTDRFYRYEQIEPISKDIMNSQSIYPSGLIYQSCLYMIATLFPRSVLNKVGGFDENFETSHDDLDMSIRCRQENIPLFVCLNSFVFHFGGASSSKTQNDDLRVKGILYFKEKHGHYPPGMLPDIMEKVRISEASHLNQA